jgi:type IV pilus assembly protein PilF
MRLRNFAALLAAVSALAACQSNPFAPKPEPTPPSPQVQPAQAPRIQQPESTPRQRAEAHVELAAGYFERAQFDVALEELGIAERIDATFARTHSIYGLVYATIGELPKAEASFRRALELAPNDSEARQNWGWYLCTHGRAKESIPEFEAAIRDPLYRTPEIALVNAGKCSVSIGDPAAADRYFRRALQLRPNEPQAAYNLALLSYRGQRHADARALMRIVMQQNTPAPEALFLGMCVEQKLGDAQAEQSYALQLRNRYPDAAETKAIGPCP